MSTIRGEASSPIQETQAQNNVIDDDRTEHGAGDDREADDEARDIADGDDVVKSETDGSTVDKSQRASQDMKHTILQYTDLCNQIRSVKEDVKILAERKKELESIICNYMVAHDIPVFKTRHGKISLYNTKKVQPLNKDFLRATIQVKITDPKIADEITTMAFSSRPVREERKVKHTPPTG